MDTTMQVRVSKRWQPWVVCFSAALFFFFIFIQLNLFNALTPDLLRDFHVNAEQLGNLSANYFYADVLFLFPAGILLDRVSTRKVLIIVMAITTLATFGFAMSAVFWQAAVCRFIIGACGAFCLLSAVRLASRWFPPNKMALVVGLIVTLAMLGGMVAQIATWLVDHIGWRSTIVYDGVVGVVIFVLIVLFVRDYPKGAEALDVHHKWKGGFWHALLSTIKNTQNWLGGLYTSCLNLPVFLLGAMWGSLYLVEMHSLSRETASLVVSMLFVGLIIGSPVIGWFSDRIRSRRKPMIWGAILSFVVVLPLMYVNHMSAYSLGFIFFALGFITSAQIISYPLIAESNPLTLTGTAEGLASVLIMAGGFTQPLFADLIDWKWQHRFLNLVPFYSRHDFQHGLMLMPLAFILALVVALLVKETNCRPLTK